MKSRSAFLSPAVCALIVLAPCHDPAHAIVRRHDRADARYLEAADEFRGAGFVVRLGRGCGTMISDRHVLTAAHVVDRFTAYGPRVRVGDETRSVSRVMIYPGASFTDPDRSVRHDLAVVELGAPVAGVEPAGIGHASPPEGSRVWVVGTGMAGDGTTGPTDEDGLMRAGTNRVLGPDPEWVRFRFDAPGDPGVDDLEAISGPGDSGGGAFVRDADGWAVVGVSSWNSGAGADICTYGSTEYYARVASYRDWIQACITTPGVARLEDQVVEGPLPATRAGQCLTHLLEALEDNDARDGFSQAWLGGGEDTRSRVAAWRDQLTGARPARFHSVAEHTLAVEFEGPGIRKLVRVYLEYGGAGRLLALRISDLDAAPGG